MSRPSHKTAPSRQRWGMAGMDRLHRALRRFYLSCGSYAKCAAAIGAGATATAVQRVLCGGVDISEDLAGKLAAKLSTTADEIAKGTWKKGAAA